MNASEAERKKAEEMERKKAEVRARLEAAAGTKKKKGFMTPERKKKLRALLRKKAAEELKKEQERKAEERRRQIAERTGQPKKLDGLNEAELQAVCREYHKRIEELHSSKFDLEYAVAKKEFEIQELSHKVNDSRGRFVKPPLKKVPKYEQKIEKMLLAARKEVGFTVALKSVKKDQFKLDDKESEKKETPEWSLKAKAVSHESKAESEAEAEE